MTERESAGQPHEGLDWELLGRHLSGESSATEARTIGRWFSQHPEDASVVDTLNSALDRYATQAPTDIDVEAALLRVKSRRDPADIVPLRGRATPSAAPSLWRTAGLIAVAASVMAVASVALWRSRADAPPESGLAGSRVHETSVAQRDSVRLPDGSQVILGAMSRLVVGERYGTTGREVALTGEAYFDVVHDDARPFVVRAGEAKILDLGTAFTVRTDDAERVRVVVTTGRVRLSRDVGEDTAGVLLERGDVGVLEQRSAPVARRGAGTDEDLAWTQGRLVFRDASLAEVRSALRRWYGVELRVDDAAIAGKHLTADYSNESADQVLRMIGLALGASVERRGDSAIVTPDTRR